ncbi:MAG: hypothetical protein MZV63_72475 [Marinilabiliales bacterium]|nr:hypothetical protein [Marinilabiliales bacterium]
MAFVIPRGFGDEMAGGRPASVMIIADGSESQSATIGVNYATMIAGRYSQRHRPRVASSAPRARPEARSSSTPRSGSGTTPSSGAGISWSPASSASS